MARSQMLTIRMTDDILTQYGNQLGAVGNGKARQAMSRAVNRVTDMAYTRVIREVAAQSSIPRNILRRAIKKQKSAHKGDGAIQGAIYASGGEISLKYFKPRQFTFGVRAKVWGKNERFPGAFINAGEWNSGNPAFGGHVMERDGAAKFPVRRIKGPSIPDELIRGKSADAFDDVVRNKLPERLGHELSRMLNP